MLAPSITQTAPILATTTHCTNLAADPSLACTPGIFTAGGCSYEEWCTDVAVTGGVARTLLPYIVMRLWSIFTDATSTAVSIAQYATDSIIMPFSHPANGGLGR